MTITISSGVNASGGQYLANLQLDVLSGGEISDNLADIGFTSGKTKPTYADNGSKTGGVLTVTDRTHTAHISLVGDFSASAFITSSDGHGGTTVVDPHETNAKQRRCPPRCCRTAMAGFDPGGGQWISIRDAGRPSFTVPVAVGHET